MSISTGAPPVRVLALWGSLRAGSSNTAPLRAALALVPSGLTTSTSQPLALPLFDEELETCDAPEAVRHLKSVARAEDASLIATPEYRASVTGVLKDALDWLLRPTRGGQFRAKPAAILGASPSLVGTARVQAPPHLAAPVFTEFEYFATKAPTRFQSAGQRLPELTDTDRCLRLAAFLEAFGEFARAQAKLAESSLTILWKTGRRS